MLNFLTEYPIENILGVIGILAAIISIITEILKNIISKSFPTKLLVLIISLIITFVFVIIFYPISFTSIAFGIIGSFIIAFVSMYGFDSFKDIIKRFIPYNKEVKKDE